MDRNCGVLVLNFYLYLFELGVLGLLNAFGKCHGLHQFRGALSALARFVGYVQIKRYVLHIRAAKQDYRHKASACGSAQRMTDQTHTHTHTHSVASGLSLCATCQSSSRGLLVANTAAFHQVEIRPR